jgi:hypothetical protein
VLSAVRPSRVTAPSCSSTTWRFATASMTAGPVLASRIAWRWPCLPAIPLGDSSSLSDPSLRDEQSPAERMWRAPCQDEPVRCTPPLRTTMRSSPPRRD